jgi:hypothetical protein
LTSLLKRGHRWIDSSGNEFIFFLLDNSASDIFPLGKYPADPMRMWRISTWVNKPENDDPSILEPVESQTAASSAL